MKRIGNRRWLVPFLLVVLCLLVFQPKAFGALIVVFKDGFVLRGMVSQKMARFVDPASKKVFTIPKSGSLYTLEAPARRIVFSPYQLADVIEEKESPIPKWMNLKFPGRIGQTEMPLSWMIKNSTPWNDRWERTLSMSTSRGEFEITQRVTFLNPDVMQVMALRYAWVPHYRTRELGVETVKHLLKINFDKTKDSELDKSIKVAKFMAQAGWPYVAKQDLLKLQKEHPGEKTRIDEELSTLDHLLAGEFMQDFERAVKYGRHNEAQKRIAYFFEKNMTGLVDEKAQLRVYELKTKYENLQKQLAQAKELLSTFTARVSKEEYTFFTETIAAIQAGLNFDTVERLQTFVDQARLYVADAADNKNGKQSADDILSYAVTGWLMGNNAAEANLPLAKKLWNARQFVLRYQNTPDAPARQRLRAEFEQQNKVDVDLISRLIRYLPPPAPHNKTDSEVQKLTVQLPGEPEGPSYYIQLPPEYHHHRSYPVLFAIHDRGQEPLDMIKTWSYLAARDGYILVAPYWVSDRTATYGFTDAETEIVPQCLRDLRRRFQVDSNRVFLFGVGEGGFMAYDVGLGHPDLFAGVLPMNAYPRYFSEMYMANAQNLPMYVVDGQINGESAQANEKMFKDWVSRQYPVIYVEYRGRGAEWFSGEFPDMIDWMNRKTRQFPQHELGKAGSGSRKSQEYATSRASDNHFYWLSTKSVNRGCINEPGENWNKFLQPARLYAKITSDNQIRVEVSGLDQVSIWLAPGMIDFSKKVKVVFNRQRDTGRMMIEPSLEVLMEDFFARGDRQQLFLARIDFP